MAVKRPMRPAGLPVAVLHLKGARSSGQCPMPLFTASAKVLKRRHRVMIWDMIGLLFDWYTRRAVGGDGRWVGSFDRS